MRAKKLLGILLTVFLVTSVASTARAYYWTGLHWPYVQNQKTTIYYNPYNLQPMFAAAVNSAANSWNAAGANFQFAQATSSNGWGAAYLDPTIGAETQYHTIALTT